MSILVLAIFALGRPATGLGLEVQQAQINRWYDIATPAGPVDWPTMPKMLRSKVRKSEPFVSIYRFQLQKGRKYTFQTEYPADYLTGSACLRGVNPLADSDVYNAPSGTSALILCKHRGFPGGNIKGYVFGRKSNFTVSSKSQHDSAYLVISSKKPNTPFRFRMIDPAENDDFIRKKGGYQLRPDRDPYHSWSNVYKKHFWLGYARGEKKKGQPVIVGAAPPAATTVAADLNGHWELLDQKGTPYVWMTLTQSGNRISGRARYKKGTAAVEGTIAGDRLKLGIIYDNPEVLKQWLPAKVCSQAVGISSEVDLDLNSDPSAYQGTFHGFWVRWDSSQNITQTYNGGSPEALNAAKSGPRVLRRVVEPVSSADGQTDQPAAGVAVSAGPGIWIEAENDRAHRVATNASARHSASRQRPPYIENYQRAYHQCSGPH